MNKHVILVVLLFLSLRSFSQKEQWDVYMAQYEKGAGSTLINMSLKEDAPMKQYPFLLKAGVKILKCREDGFPENQEWDQLYSISEKVKAKVDSIVLNKSAGTFTYQCHRTDYYYIKDTTNIRKILTSVFKAYLPDYEYSIEIKNDPAWEAYLTFLYPNEETREYMENQKVILNLTKAGDDLSKPRQVDHWLYFKTAEDREAFIKYAIPEKYKIESKDYKKDTRSHFQLHLSRTDKVDISSISAITIKLRRKARELNGEYDGWETFVIK